MTARAPRYLCLLLGLSLLAACGCGRRPAQTVVAPTEEVSPQSVTAVSMERSVIRVADPAGAWSFEGRSPRIEAQSVDGPYLLTSAECRYEEPGKPPLLMRAERVWVDEGAARVKLEGKVRISYGPWAMEADRVEHNLKTGKVVAEGRTKSTFTEERRETGTGEPVGKKGES